MNEQQAAYGQDDHLEEHYDVEEAEEIEKQLARRMVVEERLFAPFAYYRVYYAVGEGERYLHCLHSDPDEEGWWRTLRGDEQRIVDVTRVQRLEARFVDDIPPDGPRVNTPQGVVRITPPEAERLDSVLPLGAIGG